MTLLSLIGMVAHAPSPWLQTTASHGLALPRMAGAPAIDGRIGETEWYGAVSLFGFRDLATGKLFAVQPDIRVGWHAEALYLAARLPKPLGAALKHTAAGHDETLWEDDAIEWFIDPDPGDDRYFQFIANAGGATWESIGRNASFDAAWEAKTSIEEDAWIVEVRVPFASLGVPPPEEGTTWGVNVGWDRQTPARAIVTWAPVTRDFHQPEAFRKIAFSELAVPFVITGVTPPQIGRLALRGVWQGGRGKATLKVWREDAGSRLEIGSASAEGNEGEDFVLGVDLPSDRTRPTPGDYEATLLVTTDSMICADLSVPFTVKPPVEIVLAKYLLLEKKVIARVTAPGLSGGAGLGDLRVALATASGNVLHTERREVPASGETVEVEFDVGNLPSGEYQVRVAWSEDTAQEPTVAGFELPEQPRWLGSREGYTNRVLAPWTPVKVKKQTVSVWGRTYEFDGMPLPSGVTTAGAEVLAAPIRFAVQAGGNAQSWHNRTTSVVAHTAQAATIRTEADAQALSLKSLVRIEYDGVIWSELELEPRGTDTIDSLLLEIPLRSEHAKYLYHFPGRWGSAYNAGALRESGFQSAFRPYVWLGDDERGLAWFCESDQGFTPPQATDVVTIRREADQVVLRVKIIGEPIKSTEPLKFTFGMQATPVKPMKPDVWDYRICHHGNYGIEQQVWSFGDPLIYSAPGNIDLRYGTFEAWVRPQFDPNPSVAPGDPTRGKFNRNLFDVVLPNDNRIGFYWNIDDRSMRAYYKRGAEYPLILTSSSKWQKGEWHHVALTWGDETAIWIDGEKVASRPHPGTLSIPLEGGTLQLGLSPCEFDIDEIRISGIPRTSFDLTRTPIADEHTLLLDHLDYEFRPDGEKKTLPVKGSPGVPGAGMAFIPGRFGKALSLYSTGPQVTVLDRLAQLGVRTICFHEHWTDIQNYATTTHGAELKKLVTACHAKGIKLLLYFGYEMSNIAPEWDLHSDECLVYPRAGGYKRQPEQTAYIVCYNSPWQDYIVDGIAKLIDEYDIDGVYLDGTEYPWACANRHHGCGYVRPDGSLAPTYPILAYRDILRRIYTVVKTRKPDGQVNVHNSTCMVTPSLGWATSSWDGEQFGSIEPGPFALEVLPLDAFRCEFMGRQWGVPAEFLCYNRPYTYRQAMAFTLLHDVLVRGNLGGSLELESKLWHTMHEFGRDQSCFLPYWENGGWCKVNDDSVKVTGYSRGAKGVMLVVSNLGRSHVEARVAIDRKKLGLSDAPLEATDVVNDTQVPMDGDSLTFPLDSLDFKVVWVKPSRRR